jgi:hypothetical protein
VLRAILEIIAAVFRIIPGWKEKRTQNIDSEWRNNRDAINRDLGPDAWWLRDNKSDNKHNGGS